MKPSKPLSKPSARRLIVGVTGASGAIYGVRLLQALRQTDVETHLVMSRSAEVTIAYETDWKIADIHALADVVYPAADIGAAISSGSFKTMGMAIAPCSMRTLGEIASGVSSSLVSRAADVVLKERRRLVLLARETPLHLGHLKAMVAVTEMGGIVMPPVPSFYAMPETVQDIVDHTVGRLLDLFDVEVGLVKRWGEGPSGKRRPAARKKEARRDS